MIAELAKQLTWSSITARLYHLRNSDGLEVDAIIESSDGRVVAVEVKASAVPRKDDAAPMAEVRDRLDRVGSDFVGDVCANGPTWTRLVYGLTAMNVSPSGVSVTA